MLPSPGGRRAYLNQQASGADAHSRHADHALDCSRTLRRGCDLQFGLLTAMKQDRGLCRSGSCTSPLSGSLAGCSCSAAARRRRTPRSWASAMNSRSCAVRSPGPGSAGRPGGPGRPGPAAARRAATPSPGHAGHAAGLAPPPDRAQVDVPEPVRPPAGQQGNPGPGAAAGTGEPVLGIPPRARRTVTTRPPDQRGHPSGGSCAPSASQRPVSRTPPGGRSCALRRTGCWPAASSMPARSSSAALRAARHGSGNPARARPGRRCPSPVAPGPPSRPAT